MRNKTSQPRLHRDREVVDQLCRRLAVGKSAEVKPVKMGEPEHE